MRLGGVELKNNYTLPMLADNNGDSISKLNKGICEFTGMYFLWKNYDFKKPYIGFSQYSVGLDLEDYDINQILNEYKIILPHKTKLNVKLYEHYGIFHNLKDLLDLRGIFIKIYPSYVQFFDDTLVQTYLYTNNIFIMKKEDFIELCDFIWSIISVYLEEKHIYTYEDCINIVKNNEKGYLKEIKHFPQNHTIEYQSRFLAYLIERLTNVFINIKYKDNEIFTVKKRHMLKKYETD